MNTPSIKGIGTAVPPYKISQEMHYSILATSNGMSREEKLQLKKIYYNSGIESRHSVLEEFGKGDQKENILFHPADLEPPTTVAKRMSLYETYAANLCVEAVEDCLGELNVSKITHLITFSCTGMYAPGLDIQLVEKLGLNRNVERTCINFMGCYAGINALKSAYHISRSEPDAVVLVVGVELCTLHYQKNHNQDQLIANAIFADGAAACIVSLQDFLLGSQKVELALQNFYSEFEPSGKDEMVWRIGDFGFDLRLSAYVPGLIKKGILSLVKKLFAKAKIKQEDIDFYAIHPGGAKILEACEQALSITKEQNNFAYEVLRDYGNMSSVTIFFVLDKYLKSLTVDDKSKKIMACAFGPGLTMESLIAEIR